MRPQRAGRVFEQLGFELLPAELGAFVFANDLIEKSRRQVAAIFGARAAGPDADRVAHQIADQFRRARRRRYHGTRVGPSRIPNIYRTSAVRCGRDQTRSAWRLGLSLMARCSPIESSMPSTNVGQIYT